MPSHRDIAARRRQIAQAVGTTVAVVAIITALVWGNLRSSGTPAMTGGAAVTTATSAAPTTGSSTKGSSALSPAEKRRLHRLQVLAQKKAAARRKARANVPFVVSSLNVLGASHTRGPSGRRRYGSGARRIVGLIRQLVAKDVSVVGLQEFQPPQDSTFRSVIGSAYSVYPGVSLGAKASDNSLAWRDAEWKLVKASTVSIPYFSGRIRQMPYVLLRNRASGKRVWFANFHNPANIGGNMAHWRRVALSIEARLVHNLHADGTPVILTGDMNDRSAFGCPFTNASGMHSANGVYSANGRCYAPRHLDVDWILGTADVGFTDFLSDEGVHRARLTDHPMITATAKLT